MSANTSFQMINEQGWRRGFTNLLRYENAVWWRRRRWWINMLIWLALINGILLAMFSSTGEGAADRTPQQMLDEARTIFTVIAGLFGSIGAVIATQGAIIDEKKSGTAAWIMSKPASRPAFILAKLVANVIALLIIIIGVQGAVAYLQMSNFLGSALPLLPFVSGMALLALNILFYLTLTLMLGTLFNDRGPVIGIPIGVLFGAMFLMPYLGEAVLFMPWLIIPSGGHLGLTSEMMMGQQLSTTTPILATIVWIIIFVAVTLWRFQREEF